MFRKIKKFYFKIYHLFKLLGIFILIFGLKENVYASEVVAIPDHLVESSPSCSLNLVEPTVFLGLYTSGSTTPSHDPVYPYYSSYLVKVQPSTLYTLYSSYGSSSASYFVFLFNDLNSGYTSRSRVNSSTGTITTESGTNYIALGQYFPRGDMTPNNLFFSIYEGNYNGSFVDYEACSPPEPPTPNDSFSAFITLFIDRFTYLTSNFTTNPTLLAFVGIIFSFIVLELFFKILYIRRSRK